MNEVELREHLGNYKSLLGSMVPQAKRHAESTGFRGLTKLAKLFADADSLVDEIVVALPGDLPEEEKVGDEGTEEAVANTVEGADTPPVDDGDAPEDNPEA